MAVKDDEVASRDYRKRAELGRILVKEEVQIRIKLVTRVLQKEARSRTAEDQQLLDQCPEVVSEVANRLRKRAELKERAKEVEDLPPIIDAKCAELAKILKDSKYTVVYTGAGISTAASIPDYRGPNGVWTLLQRGKSVGSCDLIAAQPTLTHMSIAQLKRKGLISHVVSQNCDGLHMRSGLPRNTLSEVHGNMLIEVCKGCKPPREYIRLFDVTEKTSLRRHKTGRKCYKCNHDLVDTIVHFGERGTLKSPLNWRQAVAAAKKCDLILCLGSSLKVLRKYTCLWEMSRPYQKRPKLCIVNLQWTPKDNVALLKINGRCDDVMKKVMEHLAIEIPAYKREDDSLFKLAEPLKPHELDTTTKMQLGKVDGTSGSTDADETKPKTPSSAKLVATTSGELSEEQSLDSCCDKITCTCKEDDTSYVDLRNRETITEICSKTEPETKAAEEAGEDDDVDDEESKQSGSSSKGSNHPGWFGKGCRKGIKRKKKR